jgi:hypothetical protein
MPLFALYVSGLVWLGFYWRDHAVFNLATVRYLPVLLIVYTGICFLSNWQVRSRWMILYPYYSLAQVVVMPFAGMVWCVSYMARNRASGRFKFGFRRGSYTEPARLDKARA